MKEINAKKNNVGEKNNKKKILVIILVSLLVVGGGLTLYFIIIKPHNLAVEEYNKVVSVINDENKELNEHIKKVESLIDSKDKVIDETVITNAKEATKKAGAEKLIVKKRPFKTSEIKKDTEKYSTPPDYSENIKLLDEAYNAYDRSIKQYKQMTNPSADFVIQRLKTVDEVVDARAVTEDNDPNGKLNKAGGYTATVYFESKNVNQENWMGEDLIEKGTAAGGAIEVYPNEEDAIKRRDYLSGFDGSILSNGTHTVVGTVLIRTSDELSASKQKELERKVIDALTRLED